MLKTLIIEDNKKSAELLHSYILNLFCDIEVVGMAHNLDEAVNMIYSKKPALIFLDINLQTDSGFDVLKKTNSCEYEVIVTTAFSEYSLQAIKNSAIDYILKPYDIEELKQAVHKARKQIELKTASRAVEVPGKLDDRVFIPTLDGLVFIKIDDIVCIEADANYSEFFLINGKKVISSKSLANYDDLLKDRFFVRVHKSHLINLRHVVKYQRGRGGYVSMANGMNIKVGDSKKDELLKYLMI